LFAIGLAGDEIFAVSGAGIVPERAPIGAGETACEEANGFSGTVTAAGDSATPANCVSEKVSFGSALSVFDALSSCRAVLLNGNFELLAGASEIESEIEGETGTAASMDRVAIAGFCGLLIAGARVDVVLIPIGKISAQGSTLAGCAAFVVDGEAASKVDAAEGKP
jgi:hypothetical protein